MIYLRYFFLLFIATITTFSLNAMKRKRTTNQGQTPCKRQESESLIQILRKATQGVDLDQATEAAFQAIQHGNYTEQQHALELFTILLSKNYGPALNRVQQVIPLLMQKNPTMGRSLQHFLNRIIIIKKWIEVD